MTAAARPTRRASARRVMRVAAGIALILAATSALRPVEVAAPKRRSVLSLGLAATLSRAAAVVAAPPPRAPEAEAELTDLQRAMRDAASRPTVEPRSHGTAPGR